MLFTSFFGGGLKRNKVRLLIGQKDDSGELTLALSAAPAQARQGNAAVALVVDEVAMHCYTQ